MHRLTPIARPFKSAQANKNLRPRRTMRTGSAIMPERLIRCFREVAYSVWTPPSLPDDLWFIW